jgi:hypothetical protein
MSRDRDRAHGARYRLPFAAGGRPVLLSGEGAPQLERGRAARARMDAVLAEGLTPVRHWEEAQAAPEETP